MVVAGRAPGVDKPAIESRWILRRRLLQRSSGLFTVRSWRDLD